jgi:molecular chaperone GrpE
MFMKNDKDKSKEQPAKENKEEPNLAQHKPKEQAAEEKNYDALWDKYIRSRADFDNARKRWEREKEDLIKFADASLLRELLVVLDEVEQALKMVKEHSDIEQINKGLELTYNNFISVLKKRGLKPICALGKDFDPHLHEILASKEVEEDIKQPVVLEEVQKGYMFEDRLLRTAKVIVGIKRQTEDHPPHSGEVSPSAERPKTEDQKTETKEKNNNEIKNNKSQ